MNRKGRGKRESNNNIMFTTVLNPPPMQSTTHNARSQCGGRHVLLPHPTSFTSTPIVLKNKPLFSFDRIFVITVWFKVLDVILLMDYRFSTFFLLSPKRPLIQLRSTITCFHIPYLILSCLMSHFSLSYLLSSFGHFGQKANSVILDYSG